MKSNNLYNRIFHSSEVKSNYITLLRNKRLCYESPELITQIESLSIFDDLKPLYQRALIFGVPRLDKWDEDAIEQNILTDWCKEQLLKNIRSAVLTATIRVFELECANYVRSNNW